MKHLRHKKGRFLLFSALSIALAAGLFFVPVYVATRMLYASADGLSDDAKRNSFIARVLSVRPFIVEVLDWEAAPHRKRDYSNLVWYGIQRGQVFDPKAQSPELRFGDLIAARLEPVPCDIGFDCDPLVMDIEKLDGQARFFNPPIHPFNNRSGILIRYVPVLNSKSGEVLVVFNDGFVFYNDRHGNEFARMWLDRAEIDHLLRTFAEAGYHSLPAEWGLKDYQPGLALVHDGYHPVKLGDDRPGLKVITDELDRLIAAYHDGAIRTLEYSAKIPVKSWKYGATVPLAAASEDWSRLLLDVSDDPELLEEAREYRAYYRDSGKIYHVWLDDPPSIMDKPLMRVTAYEIPAKQSYREWYHTWPEELTIHLGSVPKIGLDLLEAEYQKHKTFYEMLLNRRTDDELFLEGDVLYRGVKIVLR
jgi:hypothetical protein